MADYRDGQTATNPKTGQKLVFKGGQWVSAAPVAGPTTTLGGRPTAAQVKAALVAKEKSLGADAVERQLNVIEQLYKKNFKGIGPSSLLEYLPTQARTQFDAAANGMRPLLKPLIRSPGEGTFTDADQALLDEQIPQGSMQDANNEQRIANIREMIANARRLSAAMGGGGRTVAPKRSSAQPNVIDFNDLPE
jgi:hypothetical protein